MTKDTIAYSRFILDGDSADDFARSPELAQIWPEALRKKTAEYFVPTHMMLAARPSSPSDAVQFVHQLLASPLDMRSNIDAIMGTDGHTQVVVDGILRRMNESPLQAWSAFSALLNDRDPPTEARRRDIMIISRQLAVRALGDKDYRLAEKYSALEQDAAAPSRDRLFFYLDLYLLTRAGDSRESGGLEGRLSSGYSGVAANLRDETLNFWRWATTTRGA